MPSTLQRIDLPLDGYTNKTAKATSKKAMLYRQTYVIVGRFADLLSQANTRLCFSLIQYISIVIYSLPSIAKFTLKFMAKFMAKLMAKFQNRIKQFQLEL